jgi:hypothetical protein
LVVAFESDVDRLLSKGGSLLNLMGSHLRTLYKIDVPPKLQKLTIKPDPELLPNRFTGGILADFTLERRVFGPYASERFYSMAPLPTEQHIRFLKSLEELAL